MEYVCDAPGGKTWFRIETEGEAAQESAAMGHAVEKHFLRAVADATACYDPGDKPFIEKDIGRREHIRRTMPMFMTLRAADGEALATAMLPPQGTGGSLRSMVVGARNADPYPSHGAAIEALARHVHLPLDRDRCYPYRR